MTEKPQSPTEPAPTGPAPTEPAMDAWAQAAETFAAATSFYAEAMEAILVASTGAMLGSLQQGMDAGSTALARNGDDREGRGTRDVVRAYSAPQITGARGSWYRPPVQNPFLEMIDDAMKPWRTFVPDHSASARAAGRPDLFGSEQAAEFMAAYHTATGFTVAQISFPDDKSVCVTMPAPWALLAQR